MIWFSEMSHFEISVLVMMMLLLSGIYGASQRLASIAKTLLIISQQVDRPADLSSEIANGIEEHERRVERSLGNGLPTGKDLYGPDWQPKAKP